MDDRDLRGCQPLMQIALAVLVHEKTDGASMHTVDRLAGIHEPLQGRQHQAIAAERDHHVRCVGPGVAVALDQTAPRPLRRGYIAGDKGNALKGRRRTVFAHGRAVSNKRQRRAGAGLWTTTMNAWCLCIRPIRLLSRRSGSAANWSSGGCAPASISCPA